MSALRGMAMMSDDVLTLADRLWRGEASIAEHHPLRHLGGLAEVGDGVAFVPSFGNVCGFATADGLVLVDTGSSLTAAAVHDELRRWSRDRLNTVIYSHGHIDHVCGLPAWEPEGAAAGWPAPRRPPPVRPRAGPPPPRARPDLRRARVKGGNHRAHVGPPLSARAGRI